MYYCNTRPLSPPEPPLRKINYRLLLSPFAPFLPGDAPLLRCVISCVCGAGEGPCLGSHFLGVSINSFLRVPLWGRFRAGLFVPPPPPGLWPSISDPKRVLPIIPTTARRPAADGRLPPQGLEATASSPTPGLFTFVYTSQTPPGRLVPSSSLPGFSPGGCCFFRFLQQEVFFDAPGKWSSSVGKGVEVSKPGRAFFLHSFSPLLGWRIRVPLSPR